MAWVNQVKSAMAHDDLLFSGKRPDGRTQFLSSLDLPLVCGLFWGSELLDLHYFI